MKRNKQLWEQVVSWDNLIAASGKAMLGKRNRPPAAAFYRDWEKELCALRSELASGVYQPSPYRYFHIYEPKKRRVAAAPFRDRVVHHAVVRVLEPLFEKRFIEDSFACRPGKGTHAAMFRASAFARRFPCALKCDIRKYFPSIDHETLMDQVGRVVGDRKVLDLIRRIVDSHADRVVRRWPDADNLFDMRERRQGLPIGNLTSQFLANVYLDGFDHFVKQELRVRGYVRYVDDFVLFGESRSQLRDWGDQVRARLAELSLTIHPDKYRSLPTSKGVDFCGFVVFADGRRRVRSSSARKYSRRYRHLREAVNMGELPVEKVTESVRAWIGHVQHAQSYRLRSAILSPRMASG